MFSSFQLAIPYSYHSSIIGQKGMVIREIISNFDVQVDVPNPDLKLDVIKVEISFLAALIRYPLVVYETDTLLFFITVLGSRPTWASGRGEKRNPKEEKRNR